MDRCFSDIKLVWHLLAGILAVGLVFPSVSFAQGNYEIQVYPSETALPGETWVELHSNMALRGSTQMVGGVLPTEHALHETVEVTHGFTPWLEVGFYTFTSVQSGGDWDWVGNHIRPRVRAPESWGWPVGAGLSLEFGYQQRRFSTDTWTLEIRPIIDFRRGPWYLAFNPSLGASLRGESQGVELQPSLKISYAFHPRISGGIEYYTSLGTLNRLDSFQQQQHSLYAAIDLNLGPEWEVNFGVGWGLTESTDRLIIKTILGRRF